MNLGGSLLFHGALQRMLMATRKIHHLRHLGFCNLVAEDAHNGDAFLMHGQHDLKRLTVGHAKEALKDVHHKLHRSVVIIEQHHLVEWRALGLRLGLQSDRAVAAEVIIIVGCHHSCHHGTVNHKKGLRFEATTL